METYYAGINGNLIPVRFISKIANGKILLQLANDQHGYSARDFIYTYPQFFVTHNAGMVTPVNLNEI